MSLLGSRDIFSSDERISFGKSEVVTVLRKVQRVRNEADMPTGPIVVFHREANQYVFDG